MLFARVMLSATVTLFVQAIFFAEATLDVMGAPPLSAAMREVESFGEGTVQLRPRVAEETRGWVRRQRPPVEGIG
jgi:hypothetical protein